MLVITARMAGSEWNLTPLLSTCAVNLRMSFEAVRLLPCQSVQALRAVSAGALNSSSRAVSALKAGTTSAGGDRGRGGTPARTEPTGEISGEALSGEHGRGRALLDIRQLWRVPFQSTLALRLFAVMVAAVSAVVALAAGMKDELEQRRRRQYRTRLHS
jgi:hypothetical protein